MAEYRRALASDAEEIVDFINYVFSEAHEPHDFKKRNPGMYDSEYPFWEDHFVAVDKGRIRATLSVTKTARSYAGVSLRAGHVGQVSVHPYARGEGHMKALMAMAIEDAKADGLDFLELNGLRQRYEYFGFTQGGCRWEMQIWPDNARHASKDLPVTLEALEGGKFRVLLDGAKKGEIGPWTFDFDDYAIAPDACKAYFAATGAKAIKVYAAPYDLKKLQGAAAFCEQTSLGHGMQYNVLNFEGFLRAGLTLKQATLADGQLALVADGAPLCATAEHGTVRVTREAKEGAITLAKMKAQALLLSPVEHLFTRAAPAGWLPISL